MQRLHPFQSVFPYSLNWAVCEELCWNPEYGFSFVYSEDGRELMLEIKGVKQSDVYHDDVPPAIQEIYEKLVFCQMDDFGNAVERDPWAHQVDGYRVFSAPDDERGPGYHLWMPTVH